MFSCAISQYSSLMIISIIWHIVTETHRDTYIVTQAEVCIWMYTDSFLCSDIAVIVFMVLRRHVNNQQDTIEVHTWRHMCLRTLGEVLLQQSLDMLVPLLMSIKELRAVKHTLAKAERHTNSWLRLSETRYQTFMVKESVETWRCSPEEGLF